MEELDGEKRFSESASVNGKDSFQGEGRFGLLNEMIAAGALQDYESQSRLLEDYYKKEYIVSRIFRLRMEEPGGDGKKA